MPNAIQRVNQTREQGRDLCGFDFDAPAELFPSRNKKGRGRITYKRFETAAEAIRFAIEDMPGGAIQSDALTLRTFAIRLVSITAASLRVPSEFATVRTVDAKRHANFRGRLKNCQ